MNHALSGLSMGSWNECGHQGSRACRAPSSDLAALVRGAPRAGPSSNLPLPQGAPEDRHVANPSRSLPPPPSPPEGRGGRVQGRAIRDEPVP